MVFLEKSEKNRHVDFVDFWGVFPRVRSEKIDLLKIFEKGGILREKRPRRQAEVGRQTKDLAFDSGIQVARVPAPHSPGARPVPYWVTDTWGKKYSMVRPPRFTLECFFILV